MGLFPTPKRKWGWHPIEVAPRAAYKMGETQPEKRPTKLRRLFFPAAAVLIVLLPLVLIEVGLRFLVPPPPVDLEDPYVSFSGIRPLFVLNSDGTRYETAEERLTFFRPQSFSASKDENTFRIFCLGGSTVQGRPYAVETSFTTWLQLNLRAAIPETEWEVVNCGGISYASYRLVPIMREVLAYEPDLFIIYTGHNEFLEDRTYGRIKHTPEVLIRLHELLLNLRSYSLAYQSLSSQPDVQTPRSVLPPEVQAKLDFETGIDCYHRDEIWREGTIAHFRYNIEIMARIAQDANVPLILMNPVSNLKDCPPFKSEFDETLSIPQWERMIGLWQQAQEVDWSNAYQKAQLLEQAAEIDGRHAGLFYMIGKCYERMARFDEAKEWFVRAKDDDICPLRILEPMHKAILEVAAKYDLPLIDVRALIEKRTQDGIPGDEWLLDHVHPSITGHQLIADSLYEAMQDIDLVPRTMGWRQDRQHLWEDHFSELSNVYFARGAERLKRLEQWSHGRIPAAESVIRTTNKKKARE